MRTVVYVNKLEEDDDNGDDDDNNNNNYYYYYYFIIRCTVYNFCNICWQFLKFKLLATFWEQEINNKPGTLENLLRCVCVCVFMYVCVYVCMFVYMHVCVCVIRYHVFLHVKKY